jgi:hypothetical protein
MKRQPMLSATLRSTATRATLLLGIAGAIGLASASPSKAVAIYSTLSTGANTVSNWTYLRPDPNPNQIYMITPNGTPNGFNAVNDIHPTGVWFNNGTHNWAIFNQDLAAMPLGTGFNVWSPQAAGNVYTHFATAANIQGNYTYLNHPYANNSPYALIWVTSNWNPNGRANGVYNNHNIGVWYDSRVGRWAVFNQDLAPMPVNAAFNVVIEHGPQYPHRFVVRNLSSVSVNRIYIDSAYSNAYPYAQIFLTSNWNPFGTSSGVYNNHVFTVKYDPTLRKWYIQNQDGWPFSPGAAFNVWVAYHS